MSERLRFPRLADSVLSRLAANTAGRMSVSTLLLYLGVDCADLLLLSQVDVLPPPHPRGTPGSGKSLTHSIYSSEKARKVLGIEFKKLEEVFKDTEEGLRKRGWGVTS